MMSTATSDARRGARGIAHFVSGLLAAAAFFVLGRPGQAAAMDSGSAGETSRLQNRNEATDPVGYVDVTDLGEGFGQPYPRPHAE